MHVALATRRKPVGFFSKGLHRRVLTPVFSYRRGS
jgi:hypothetical protein